MSNVILAQRDVTISDNLATSDGGGIFCLNSSPILVNCILWNDIQQEIYFSSNADPNTITISYSDIQDGEAGIIINDNGTIYWEEGNIDLDPLFTDELNGNFHLTENSPCIDAGDPNYPFDPDGTISDMGAFYFNQLSDINEDEIQNLNMSLYNYPNPFNPNTTIKFSIQNDSKIKLLVFNIKGQNIKTLVQNEFTKGSHSIIWNGDDEFGKLVSSGIYYYKLIVDGKTEAVKKCLLLK